MHFLILFVLMSLLITFQNLLFKKIYMFCFLMKKSALSKTWLMIIKKSICFLLRRVFMEEYSEYYFKTHVILAVFFYIIMYNEKEF